ncbi:hypothetical protein N665_1101s0015 [Sinapis alba]|nr:hypothetical protein N665_1101s0015 [Sinapis alba]
MFAARVRASLKPLLHGRHSSSLNRNREIVTSSRRVVLDRYSDGYRNLTSLRLTENEVRTKLSHRGIQFHSSSSRCYSSESGVGEKDHATLKKDRNQKAVVVELLTEKKPETFQVEKPELSQKTKGKKKKHEQADSVSKPKLLTEKPEAYWETNGKSKAETHASSKPTESLSPIPDHEPKAQSIISPSSESRNETSSNVSSTSDETPSTSGHSSSVLVIRISNLNSKTTDTKIHSRCFSISSLEGLARVNEDSVNVSFRARNMNEANSILEKLNEATVDHSQWRAEIVPEAEEASRDQMGMRISGSFEDMKKQLMMRQILVKDLEILVNSLVHLENHPIMGLLRICPSPYFP